MDQYHWRIQKFENAPDAFNNMSQEWGECACVGFTTLFILNDESFEKMIKARALHLFVKKNRKEINTRQMNVPLGRNSNKVSGELLDFNYFLYSSRSKLYYTSIMDFHDDHVYLWSDRQWEIFDELWELYSFDDLINEAEMVFKMYRSELFSEEDYLAILEEYDWSVW